MEKIRHIHKEDVKDIHAISKYINNEAAKRYSMVLNMALEQYLGRPFDEINDSNRLSIKYLQNGNSEYYLDGKPIGTMSSGTVNDADDFPKDKITFFIKFTPAI